MNSDVKTNSDEVIPVYLCDPERNHKCTKKNCGESCFWTVHKEYGLSEKPVKYIRSLGENK